MSRRRITWHNHRILSDPLINAKVPNKKKVGGGVRSDWYNLRASRGAERKEGRYLLRDMRTRTAQDYVNYASRCGAPALCQEGRGHAYLTRAGGMLVCLFNARPVDLWNSSGFSAIVSVQGGRQEGQR